MTKLDHVENLLKEALKDTFLWKKERFLFRFTLFALLTSAKKLLKITPNNSTSSFL